MTDLLGQVAVITGAGGGIGRATALRLAARGADVAILDVDLAISKRWNEQLTAASVMGEVEALGRRSIGVEGDLSDRQVAQDAIAQVTAKFGRIDILVNCAGGAFTPTETSRGSDCTEADLDILFRSNFLSMLHCCQAAIPVLKKHGGAIVNMASNGVDTSLLSGVLALYCSFKAAVLRYSQSLAVELGPDGIRVNIVSPGLIESARFKTMAAGRPVGTSSQAAVNPLRRLGTPDDVARVIAFLASAEAAYVNGENIRINGGGSLVAAG